MKKNSLGFYAVISTAGGIPFYLKLAISNQINLATPNKTTKYLNTDRSMTLQVVLPLQFSKKLSGISTNNDIFNAAMRCTMVPHPHAE